MANNVSVAEWLRTGLQIRTMQVRALSLTPFKREKSSISIEELLERIRSWSVRIRPATPMVTVDQW